MCAYAPFIFEPSVYTEADANAEKVVMTPVPSHCHCKSPLEQRKACRTELHFSGRGRAERLETVRVTMSEPASSRPFEVQRLSTICVHGFSAQSNNACCPAFIPSGSLVLRDTGTGRFAVLDWSLQRPRRKLP